MDAPDKPNPYPPGTPTHIAFIIAQDFGRLRALLGNPPYKPLCDMDEMRNTLEYLEDAASGIGNTLAAAEAALSHIYNRGEILHPDSADTATAVERARLYRASAQQAAEKTQLAMRRTSVALLSTPAPAGEALGEWRSEHPCTT